MSQGRPEPCKYSKEEKGDQVPRNGRRSKLGLFPAIPDRLTYFRSRSAAPSRDSPEHPLGFVCDSVPPQPLVAGQVLNALLDRALDLLALPWS